MITVLAVAGVAAGAFLAGVAVERHRPGGTAAQRRLLHAVRLGMARLSRDYERALETDAHLIDTHPPTERP